MRERRRGHRAARAPQAPGPNRPRLEALGERIDEARGTAAPLGATPPNAAALQELGTRIDASRGAKRHGRHRRRRRLRLAGGLSAALVLLLAGGAGGAYLYLNAKVDALKAPLCELGQANVCAAQVGPSFNVLVVGSDSRGGLPPSDDKFFGGPGQVSGQRSDVVKIFHVDPANHTISVVSIPRDTIVSLLANQSVFGSENRINVNFQNGPGLLAKTIEANFGIPINHIVVVSFGGLVDAVNDIGGVWMYFPYPALDHYSSLYIPHTGCQHLDGFQALAVARSRHFEYLKDGAWQYDGTSDFGRIDRQNQFLRALIDQVKAQKLDVPQLFSFLTDLPKGVQIDEGFSTSQLLGLLWDFKSFDAARLQAYTLPVVGATSPVLGDILYVDQPASQQLLVDVFGQVGTPGGLLRPTNPPPDQDGVVVEPPAVTVAVHHAATTPAPLHTEPWYTFNPVACTPS